MEARLRWRDRRVCTGTSIIARNFPDAPTVMCKAVGGSTVHWAAMCPRLQEHEFKTASLYGAIAGADIADWPLTLSDLEPFYDRAEDKMGVTGTNGIPRHPPTNNYKVMAAGARRIGYTQVRMNNTAINSRPRDGRNACDQIGFCMQGCVSGAKWSTANSELPKAGGGVSGAGGCAAARCRTVQARGAVAQALRRVRSARRGQARLGGLRFVLLRHHLRCPARGAASGDHAGDHASRAPISDLGRCRPDGLGRRYLPQAVPTCAEGRGAGERQRRWLPDGERARPVHVRPHGDLAPRADAALRQAARS